MAGLASVIGCLDGNKHAQPVPLEKNNAGDQWYSPEAWAESNVIEAERPVVPLQTVHERGNLGFMEGPLSKAKKPAEVESNMETRFVVLKEELMQQVQIAVSEHMQFQALQERVSQIAVSEQMQFQALQERVSHIEAWMTKDKLQGRDLGRASEGGLRESLQSSWSCEHREIIGLSEGYEISESTWDAAIWLFTPALGSQGSSLLMLLILAINVVMQSLLASIVTINFTSQVYGDTELKGLDSWRLQIAHGAGPLSELYPVSVATQVCEHDVRISTSVDQAIRAQDLQSYFSEKGQGYFGNFFNGVSLCLLAIMIQWVLTVQEMLLAMDLVRACGRLPKSEVTEFSFVSDGYEVLSIHPIRFCFTGFIAIIRAGIAAVLLVVGTMWLANTATITELFLNSVALVFIMDIDELLYRALGPSRLKWHLKKIKPLTVHKFGEWRGLDIRSLLLTVSLIFGGMMVWQFYLSPLVDSLWQAEELLCGGNTDFVYRIDPLGMTRVFPTKKIKDVATSPSPDDTTLKAVREAIDLSPDNFRLALTAPMEYFDYMRDVEYMSMENYAEYLNINSDCEDILVDGELGHDKYREYMRYWTKNLSLQSCQSLSQYCVGLDEGRSNLCFMTRLFCPNTCGCANWQNGTRLSGNVHGCPSSCSSKTKEILRARKDDDCWEPGIIELRDSEVFSKWIDEFASLGSSSAQLFNTSGCSAVRTKVRNSKGIDTMVDTDLCHGQGKWSNFKPLAGLCPISCDCVEVIDDPSRQFCLGQCSYYRCKDAVTCSQEYKIAVHNETHTNRTCVAVKNFRDCLDLIAENCSPGVQERDAKLVDWHQNYILSQMHWFMGYYELNCTEVLGYEEHPEFHQRVWEGWAGSYYNRNWLLRDSLILDLRGALGISVGKWKNQVDGPDAIVPFTVNYNEEEQAWAFFAEGHLIFVPIATNPSKMSAVTYSAWVKPLSWGKKGWVLTQSPDYGWSRSVTISDGRLGGTGVTAGGRDRGVYNSKLGNLPIGRWSHLVGVWSSNGGPCTIYANMTKYTRSLCKNGQGNSGKEMFVIGGRNHGDKIHNGHVMMTDVAVFNKSLTDDEVKLLYNGGMRPSYPWLVLSEMKTQFSSLPSP